MDLKYNLIWVDNGGQQSWKKDKKLNLYIIKWKRINKVEVEDKQSLRAWYKCIDSFFVKDDFMMSKVGHSWYLSQAKDFLLVLILNVDDLIILSNTIIRLG